MPPRQPSNRIEVDLKLLQDRNIERLEQFGKQFDKSVGTLATLIGSFNEQVQGARPVGRPGQPGPDASTASTVRIDSVPARQGGNVPPWAAARGTLLNEGRGGYEGGASVAGPDGVTDPGSPDTFEQQYVRATKRIGALPVGLRQTLGYMAEGGFGSTPAWTGAMDANGNVRDEDGNLVQAHWARRGASKLNNFMFQTQAIKANMMLGAGKVQSFFGTQQARTALGQNLGYSREGGFLGVMNPAWKTGFMETLKTGLTADFGFSPYYSLAQAQQARQTLQGYGYSGDTSDRLAGMLKELQIHQGIDAASAMSVIDPMMRFGGPESIGKLTSVLQSLPGAAAAARMNLQQFTQELVSTAQQISSATGMTVGGAMSGLAAYSAVTGVAPSVAAATISNPTSMFMASGLTGKSLWDVTYGQHAVSSRLEMGALMWKNATGGMSAQEMMRQIKSGNSSVMNGVMALWNANHDIFGGMSPIQYLHAMIANRGNIIGHQRIEESLVGAGSDTSMDRLLKAWGGPAGSNMSHQFEIWAAKHPIGDAKSPASHRAAALAFAEKLIHQQNRNANTRASRQVTIGLSNEAKKYFTIVADDTPQRNSIGAHARSAMGTVGSIAGDIGHYAGEAEAILSLLP